MDTRPKCISCGQELGHDSYLGYCPDCALWCANPVTHTIMSIVIGVIGFIIFSKMDSETPWTENLMGGAVFALTSFGWNFLTSCGFRATGIGSGILKICVSPFVGLVGFPVIMFRLLRFFI